MGTCFSNAQRLELMPAQGGLQWHLWARVVQMFDYGDHTTQSVKRTPNERRLFLAREKLEADDFHEAVRILEQVKGPARDVLHDWLEDTRLRLKLESCASVLQ